MQLYFHVNNWTITKNNNIKKNSFKIKINYKINNKNNF